MNVARQAARIQKAERQISKWISQQCALERKIEALNIKIKGDKYYGL